MGIQIGPIAILMGLNGNPINQWEVELVVIGFSRNPLAYQWEHITSMVILISPIEIILGLKGTYSINGKLNGLLQV